LFCAVAAAAGLCGVAEAEQRPPAADLGEFECAAAVPSMEAALRDPKRFIAHAGGAIDGKKYTNSREAIMAAIRNGYQLIELDLLMTADGHLVAAHDWKRWRMQHWLTRPLSPTPTRAEFLALPASQKWTAMNFSDIVAIFEQHPQLILVTDKTNHFEYLAENFPFPDRLLVEVFSVEDLRRAKEAGIRYPMPSNLWGRRGLESLIQAYDLKFLAMNTSRVKPLAKKIRQARALGVCTFAFSTNERSFLKSSLPRGLFGVYTDYFIPEQQRFVCAGPCTTY
jgi:hypothetical protein